jgi:hypothetical protein
LLLDCDAVSQRLNISTHATNLLVTLVLKLPPIGSERVHVAFLQLHAAAHHDCFLFQPLQQANCELTKLSRRSEQATCFSSS